MSFRLTGVFLLLVPPPKVMFELSYHSIEGVADCHVEILVRVVHWMLAIDHQLVTRYIDVHADSVELSLLVMIMGRFDDDMTAGDVLVEPFEPTGFLPDPLLDGLRMGDASKRDLQFVMHRLE